MPSELLDKKRRGDSTDAVMGGLQCCLIWSQNTSRHSSYRTLSSMEIGAVAESDVAFRGGLALLVCQQSHMRLR
jgi:hypothetical protein